MSHRGHKRTRSHVEMLRKEAEARQVEYDQLTTQQKLDKLNHAAPPPKGQRQREKLQAQLEGKSRPLTNAKEVITLTPAELTPIVEPTPKAKERRKQEQRN